MDNVQKAMEDVRNHANLDVFQAVARGELSTHEAGKILRGRAKDARRGKPVRHFASLFTAEHMDRAGRRGNAAYNRRIARENYKAREYIVTECLSGYMSERRANYLLDRLPQPRTVGLPGIVFKAAWPSIRETRTAMKVAQRRIRKPA